MPVLAGRRRGITDQELKKEEILRRCLQKLTGGWVLGFITLVLKIGFQQLDIRKLDNL